MYMDESKLEELQQLCHDSDSELRRDYSGRGMYGEQCVGIDCPSIREAVKVLVTLAFDEPDLAAEMAECLSTDQMGLGQIVYFPRVQAEVAA